MKVWEVAQGDFKRRWLLCHFLNTKEIMPRIIVWNTMNLNSRQREFSLFERKVFVSSIRFIIFFPTLPKSYNNRHSEIWQLFLVAQSISESSCWLFMWHHQVRHFLSLLVLGPLFGKNVSIIYKNVRIIYNPIIV